MNPFCGAILIKLILSSIKFVTIQTKFKNFFLLFLKLFRHLQFYIVNDKLFFLGTKHCSRTAGLSLFGYCLKISRVNFSRFTVLHIFNTANKIVSLHWSAATGQYFLGKKIYWPILETLSRVCSWKFSYSPLSRPNLNKKLLRNSDSVFY